MSSLRGITFKILSVCVFVAMSAIIKATAEYVPPGQAVFFRSLFAIPVIGVWLALSGDLRTGIRWGISGAAFWARHPWG